MSGDDVLEILKSTINKKEYQYIDKIRYDRQKSSESKFIFLSKNSFILNWAKRNYKEKIKEIIKKYDNIEPQILFLSESNNNEQIEEKKYIIKNTSAFTNMDYRFDNFIVGECNIFAFECAKKTVEKQGIYNPLLIYGNTGLGKSHLLHSICNAAYIKSPGAAVIFVTAETMFNEYRTKVNNRSMDQFRERFRKCDYLLIDDVQFLSKTDKFQEEFFNTFNDIVANGGQIVLISDRAPKKIEKLETRLKSRFMGGMMAKIESPELNTKISVIKQKCMMNDIKMNDEVINLLAIKYYDNIREIEGMISTIYGYANIMKLPVTPELVKNVLKEDEEQKGEINFNDILHLISIEYNLKPSEIKSKARGNKKIAKARKIVAYIARNEKHASFPDIAEELNLKGHSAVSKQIKTISDEIQKDSNLKMEIQNLISKLKQKNT